MNPILEKSYLTKHAKKLFTVYWEEMGNARSFNKLQKWCLKRQIVEPRSLNQPTRMGLWKAMWRWAAKNRDEAFEIYSKAPGTYPEEWSEMIVKYSRTSFQNKTFKKEYENAH
jgi:hypothetical protein